MYFFTLANRWISLLLILLSLLFLSFCNTSNDTQELLYVGTFSDRGDAGLQVLRFDRDAVELHSVQTVNDRTDPGFQALHPNETVLYSVSREPFSSEMAGESETLTAYSINKTSGTLTLLNELPVQGQGSAHVSVDPQGEFIYVSNYRSGNLNMISIGEDGRLEEVTDVIQHTGSSVHPRQEAPHVHAADPSPDGRFLYVSDLGLDKIMIYAIDRDKRQLVPAETPFAKTKPAAGPRHFTFHPNGQFAYSVEELSSTVAVYEVDKDGGGLKNIQRIAMLPPDFEGANKAADIHISPDGRFLYASNRGHQSLAIYQIKASTGTLSLVGREPTQGDHPRNFMIDSRGQYLFVANMNSDNIVIFERDPETGLLTYTGKEYALSMPVCLTQVIL